MAYSSTKKKSADIVQISIGILTVILVVSDEYDYVHDLQGTSN